MTRGRRHKLDRPIKTAVYVPESLFQEAQIRLSNPLTGRIPPGAWSGLMTKLLKKYFADLNEEERQRLAGRG